LPFWLHAMPANVRCSPIPHLPALSLAALLSYHVERLAQSFPSRVLKIARSSRLLRAADLERLAGGRDDAG
jgi:hypothetical protein